MKHLFNVKPLCMVIFSIIFLQVFHLQATNYYVAKTGNDLDSGTFLHPFLTIHRGVTALAAGDTLFVLGGVYEEHLSMGVMNGLDLTRTITKSNITIKAYDPANRPILKPYNDSLFLSTHPFYRKRYTICTNPKDSIAVGNYSVILIYGASNVVLDGFVLDGANTASCAFGIGASSNITIQNCEIKNGSNGYLSQGGSANLTFRNLLVHDNGYCMIGYHGLYFVDSNSVIENCKVYNNGGNGIKLGTDDAGETRKANNNIIRNNECYGNGVSGILITKCRTGNLLYNNVCYRNASGIQVTYAADSVKVYNNTCFDNLYYGIGIPLTAGNGRSDSRYCTVKSNICYQNKCAGNLVVDPYSVPYNTLSNNLVSDDPRLVNRTIGNARLLTGSPAIDAGDVFPEVTTDFDGNPRDGTPNIGAFEGNFSGSYSHSLHVSGSGNDNNPGTHGDPLRTIKKALSMMVSGDTLFMLDGEYPELIVNEIPTGKSSTQPTVIMAYPGQSPEWKVNSTVTVLLELYIDRCARILQHVVFDGIRINASNCTVAGVRLSTNVNNITFKNCEIYSNKAISGVSGIYIHNVSGNHNKIMNCKIHDFTSVGLWMYGDTNLISKSEFYATTYGIYEESGNLNTIEKSRFHHNSRGVLVSGTNSVIKNNVCWQNGTGIYANGQKHKIYNNTSSKNSTGLFNTGLASSVRNNIFSLNSTAWYGVDTGFSHNLYDSGTDPGFVDANNYDFRLTNESPAIDSGVTLTEVIDDVTGITRPKRVKYDLGAYEDTLAAHGFYVAKTGNNGNPGTFARPFLTIAKGLSVITAGDTLYVLNGVYDEYIALGIPTGVSWNKPVVLKAYPGHTPELKRSDFSRPLELYHTSGGQAHKYIVIDGFKFYIGINSGIAATISTGAHHIRIKNCEFYGDYTKTATIGVKIYSTAGKYNEFVNCRFHHLTMAGLWMYGDSNVVSGSEFDTTQYGIYVEDGVANIIEKSNFHHNARGIWARGSQHLIRNNICRANGTGIYPNGSYIKIYNNTSCKNSYGLFNSSIASSVRNNIFLLNTTNYSNGDTGFSNNLTSSLVDPLFVDAANNDFHLSSGSPAIDAGITLADVTGDYDGVLRNDGFYDIGAYEYCSGGCMMKTSGSEEGEQGETYAGSDNKKVVTGEVNTMLSSVSLYPNPSGGQVFIAADLTADELISIAIYDMKGARISVMNNVAYSKGKHQIGLNSTLFAGNGMYIITVTTSSTSNRLKVLISK